MKVTLQTADVLKNLDSLREAIICAVNNPYCAGVAVRDLLGNPLGTAEVWHGTITLDVPESYVVSLRRLADLIESKSITEIRDYAGEKIGDIEYDSEDADDDDSEDSDYEDSDDSEDSDYDDSEDSDA